MFVLTIILNFLFLNTDSNLITQDMGLYTTETGKGRVSVYIENNELMGKLVWSRDHELPSKDIVILKGFRPKGKYWVGGTLYNPENKKTYTPKIEIFDNELALLIKYGLYTHKVIWKKST